MKTWVILNPNAGSADEIDTFSTAVASLGDVAIHTTERAEDAIRLAREGIAAGYDRIIAAGGDGTINEVLNGIAPNFDKVEFGIIPLGTGNDFARSINMPKELDDALKIFAMNQTRLIDVVRVQSETSDLTRYYLNVSAGGFSGLLNEKLTDDMKQTWGPLAYVRAASSALPDLTEYHTWLSFDDEEPHEVPTYNLVVANARYVAGGIPVAPQAVLDDGLLDVVIIPVASMVQLATLIPLILLGNHTTSDLIEVRRARKVRIKSTPGMWFNVDGELVGNEPATFEIIPRALKVIVGPEPDIT